MGVCLDALMENQASLPDGSMAECLASFLDVLQDPFQAYLLGVCLDAS